MPSVVSLALGVIASIAAGGGGTGVMPPPPHPLFFFNDTATTEIYTLSLHDALPIYSASNRPSAKSQARAWREGRDMGAACAVATGGLNALRSCAGEGIRQLLDIGLQCARPGVGQGVPVGCIQIDHLLAAPGLGGAHQRVVQIGRAHV